MKISVQTGGMSERFGVEETYRLIRESGFEGVDANLDHVFSSGEVRRKNIPELLLNYSDETFFEFFKPWRDGAAKYGVENVQAHSVFPGWLPGGDSEYNDFLLDLQKKMIRASAFIGCRRLVIHPFFGTYDSPLPAEEEFRLNLESYSALADTAKECGVIICLENMFVVHRGKAYAACCSDIGIACELIDALNERAGERRFGFCLDTGHILLTGTDIFSAMVRLGDRIEAFHIHDNNGIGDQHLAPYMGVLDWTRFTDGLKAIGFDKPISFETFNIWNTVDPEVAPAMLKFIAETGKMFVRKAMA